MRKTRGRRRGTIVPKIIGTGTAGRQVLNQWVVRVSQGTDPITGQRIRVNEVVRGTKADAETRLTELLTKTDQHIPIPRGRLTLGEWLDESLKLWADELAPATVDGMRQTFGRYVTPELKARRLDNLRAEDFKRLYQDMARRELSATTIAYLHRALRAQLNRAVKLGKLARSPLVGVLPPRPVHQERETLSSDQAQTFLAALDAERFGPLFTLLLATGMRPAEAMALQWADVDGAMLQIRRSLVWLANAPWSFQPTKGKRARRVRLPAVAQRALQRQKARQAGERLKLGAAYTDHGLIFATELGTPLRWCNVSRVFREIRTGLGWTLRAYDLRHSFATLALASGEPVKSVQEALGHSSALVTLDVYAHVTGAMQEQLAAKMDTLLGGAPKAAQG
jgi:integrase